MGNFRSSDHFKHGEISVALEKEQYMAGEKVKGYVNFNVTGALSAKDLSIKFAGTVKTVVKYLVTYTTDHKGHPKTERHCARQWRDLFEQQAILIVVHYVADDWRGID